MSASTQAQEDNLLMFLDGLTELSRRHKIGIADQPTLFIMDDDDLERAYSVDDESKLIFR